MSVQGIIKNGVAVLDNPSALAEGTRVTIAPITDKAAAGTVTPAGQAPDARPRYRVSTEKREALLSLIGIWNVDNPPNDQDIELILEEERMKKYGG